MQFLSDIFVRCPDCQGRRYRSHVLEIKLDGGGREWSIADLLEATADDAVTWLRTFADSKFAARAIAPLEILCEVGLGYLRLGQPVNTLSGGECQRLKLASHLAEHQAPGAGEKRSLFIFDEPTTGLHFEDVRILVQALRRMVAAGHSVVVVEHNLQLIAAADWVIDLGPDAGSEGGLVVCEGTPAMVSKSLGSHTASALRAEGQLSSQVT